MPPVQQPLFSDARDCLLNVPFPSTRFQGSKRKVIDWIWANVRDLRYDTVLDLFGGTSAVSHLFKRAGKQVTYNDRLAFNWQIGLALIENNDVTLTTEDMQTILKRREDVTYPDFIERTFQGIYFTDEENRWLDCVIYNIDHFMQNPFKQALARFALYQACIIKRPYNLFHRANLYMREAEVSRSFGNKTTWDTAFEFHFRTFVAEANIAVFGNGRKNQALCLDANETPIGADLVYIDPPYLNAKGVGVDYRDFYHFLEGLTNYASWRKVIDYNSRHRRLLPQHSPWNHSETILGAFEEVISRHQHSIIVVSYRDDGIPSKATLLDLLKMYKSRVREATLAQQYALSRRNSHEMLLIGT